MNEPELSLVHLVENEFVEEEDESVSFQLVCALEAERNIRGFRIT